MRATGRVRLVHLTTVPETLMFLTRQVGEMAARGFEVAAISSPGAALETFGRQERIATHAVVMERRITPLRDLSAVGRIYHRLRRLRPHIVHAHTPKGGLLGMLAAWLARVPVRIYNIHGLPFTTATGARRRLLWSTERVSCALAHRVLCVSASVREVAMAEGLCRAGKIAVLGSGTINGVDAEGRFDPTRQGGGREATRARLGIPLDALVLGFVGRVVRDKGIVELSQAWQSLRAEFPSLRLLLAGPVEPQDAPPAEVLRRLHDDPRIHLAGMVDDPAPLYGAMDVVVLPTYREGFPTVLLEAAAMAIPVVASRVPGCVDAVLDGVTGTLVPPREAEALARAIAAYLRQPGLRREHGDASRARVLKDYRPEAVWDAIHREYLALLATRGVPVMPATSPRQLQAD